MLNKDYANVTSAIGARTLQPAAYKSQPNWGLMLAQGVNAYNDKQAYDSYVKQLTEAHPEDAALIARDPDAYQRALQEQANAERDQQFKMDVLDKQFNNSVALADRQNANSYALAQFKANLQNKLAKDERERQMAAIDDALAKGYITEQQANMARAKMTIGDIVGGTSENLNNPFEKKRVENIAKNMDADIQKSQATLNKYQQAANLLSNIETGGAAGQAKEKAWNMFLSPDEQKFRALSNEILPTMRPTGSGSTSDKDMAVFEKATFGLSKNKDANESIIKGRIAAEENNIAHLQFLADGYNQGVPLSELDKMWNKYLNENNIFNDDGSLNKKRKTAQEYFYGGLQSQNSKNEQIPVGTVEDGYRFKGGNPSDPNNWEEVQ